MSGIEPHLNKRLQETLLQCTPFASDNALKAIFVDNRLYPWRNAVPHADSIQGRVLAVIEFLSDKQSVTGENGLVLLLQVLSDPIHPDDKLHHDLVQLTEELDPTHTTQKNIREVLPKPVDNDKPKPFWKPTCQISITIALALFVVVILFAVPQAKKAWEILIAFAPTPTDSPICSVQVQDFTFTPKVVRVNGTVQVMVNIDNPNGLGVKYNWSVTDGKVTPELNAIQPNSTYTAPDYPGNQTIMVEVLPVGCYPIQSSGQIVVVSDSPTPSSTPITNTPIPSTDTPSLTPTSTVVNTLEPVATQQATTRPLPPTATPTNAIPAGKLAVSLKFGVGSRVYITAFDGKAINGEQTNAIPNAKQPMWSRDGNSVIVNGQVDQIQGLFKLNTIGFDPEVIIPRRSARWPVLSPAGNEIIFSEETLQDTMFRRQANGDIIDIIPVRFNNYSISAKYLLWSDDNILVFQGCKTWEADHEGECGTWATSASNLNPQRIIEGNDDFPMDAKLGKLAFVTAKDGDWDVYIMPLTGPRSQAINLTNNTAQDGMPAISPDGKLVAYLSNESGSWAIWTVTIEGTDKHKWFDINPERGTVDFQTWVDDRMSWSK